ncbi:uncharacterized protein LOC107814962 [Nicotiana tabacum]|uniref:Uncharacterized protein LOC107814962 n=1 Tax=Nicotiana tabacum TaxID=4097 RepID=A0AC58UHK4_TOBAC
MKWRLTSRVLCDKNVSLKLKGMIYKAVVRPTMMYEAECWLIKNFHVQKMKVTEMRMLRCMCHHTRLNKIMNEVIRYKVGVAPMEDKMREARLRWFRHVNRRSTKAQLGGVRGTATGHCPIAKPSENSQHSGTRDSSPRRTSTRKIKQ